MKKRSILIPLGFLILSLAVIKCFSSSFVMLLNVPLAKFNYQIDESIINKSLLGDTNLSETREAISLVIKYKCKPEYSYAMTGEDDAVSLSATPASAKKNELRFECNLENKTKYSKCTITTRENRLAEATVSGNYLSLTNPNVQVKLDLVEGKFHETVSVGTSLIAHFGTCNLVSFN